MKISHITALWVGFVASAMEFISVFFFPNFLSRCYYLLLGLGISVAVFSLGSLRFATQDEKIHNFFGMKILFFLVSMFSCIPVTAYIIGFSKDPITLIISGVIVIFISVFAWLGDLGSAIGAMQSKSQPRHG